MAVSTPPSELEGPSSSPGDKCPETSRTPPIDHGEPSEKFEHGNSDNEKRHSSESLYEPHGSKANDTDSEHSSESQHRPATRTVSEVRDGIESRRDVEIGESDERCSSVASRRDPNLVTWDSPDDLQNPKNWAYKKKWATVVVGKQSYTVNKRPLVCEKERKKKAPRPCMYLQTPLCGRETRLLKYFLRADSEPLHFDITGRVYHDRSRAPHDR